MIISAKTKDERRGDAFGYRDWILQPALEWRRKSGKWVTEQIIQKDTMRAFQLQLSVEFSMKNPAA